MTTFLQPAISVAEHIDQYLDEVVRGIAALDRGVLRQVAEALISAWRDGRQVFIMGNGGSASTASHMALDLNKMTSIPGQTAHARVVAHRQHRLDHGLGQRHLV